MSEFDVGADRHDREARFAQTDELIGHPEADARADLPRGGA
jgi:hypothetical protein